jgi:parvulin-like peptidyl-prolyl isomerase
VAKDPAALAQVVRTYLARLAVLREAKAKKLAETPAARAQLERVRDQALTELYLLEVSRPPEGYPSEGEIQAAYEANRDAFVTPRQFRLAQIFVLAGREAGEAGRRADELARKARQKGADFAALAGAESDEKDAAARGGEIGWLTEEQMVPGIRAVVAGLAKEGIAGPVKLDDGFHVVKVLDLRPAAPRAYGEVKGAIAAQLRAETVKLRRQAFLARLLEANPPAVNELALAKVLAKDPAAK